MKIAGKVRRGFFVGVPILFLLVGCVAMKFGKDAIPMMEGRDIEVLETLREYTTHTTEEDIRKDFGAPKKDALTRRPAWELSTKAGKRRIYAYFFNRRLTKIHYFSIAPKWGHVLHYRGEERPIELNK